MLLEKERQEIVTFGRRLVSAGLTKGTGGNLSILSRDRAVVAISPTALEYFEMQPEDVVIVDMEGRLVEGSRRPSSEVRMHLGLYEKRPDIGAVVHGHPVFCTTLACLRWEIPPVHYLVGLSGDKVPVAPYATYGSGQLAAYAAEAIGEYNAVLLANHGLIAVGPTLSSAFSVAEQIELVAEIYYRTKCLGDPAILGAGEMEEAIKKLRTYGTYQ